MLVIRNIVGNGISKKSSFFLTNIHLYPAAMRPSTLNLRHQQNHDVSRSFLREAFNTWKECSENNIVPEHKIKTLFSELKLFLQDDQVHDIIRTAKLIERGSLSKHKNGITFGEFSVLLSDIRKLRYTSILNSHDASQSVEISQVDSKTSETRHNACISPDDNNETVSGPEVFLGGSCNPTTWRADIAIPTLNLLGITFYNPQVSEWTPDLLELEHRAKEKARVLFFVMDSQTRSTAGAIEVAHIAGKNSKRLVLVLLPYKPKQKILNETLSADEYMDLSRNQLLLRQLMKRRGLPVLDNIPLALEYIKNVLSGGACREHPQNVATRLISVRRTYDRVADNSKSVINLVQCQKAMVALGYPPGITSTSVINQILTYFKEVGQQNNREKRFKPLPPLVNDKNNCAHAHSEEHNAISFDEFCILDSYLSVLHQDILETSCVSPIKGTNLQQPLIYLTDSSDWSHRIVPPSPNTCKIWNTTERDTRPQFETSECWKQSEYCFDMNTNASSSNSSQNTTHNNCMDNNSLTINPSQSTMSSNVPFIRENSYCQSSNTEENNTLEIRDLYIGGSCSKLTKWQQKCVVPYLKSQNITFYSSTLSEGLDKAQQNDSEMVNEVHAEDELMFNPSELDASRILLFVITNETRSLGAMTMSAHYIGMGYNIVMCVQMMNNNCSVRGSQLSDSAVKDYNRGRAYLVDLAKRHGIPVFEEIDAAVKCAVEKLRL
uniref:Putative nucleoside 2-deoxyribosyltransferase like protein n=1 Tax=Culex tarsalis TaxID=7177 RepID=A0A1Q3FKN2_CULTA